MNIKELLSKALSRDKFWLAKLISLLEANPELLLEYGDLIWKRSGRAHVIGVTGVGGAGKSTLIASLVRLMRSDGKYIGIVSIDPSSPYSGGAILGDRVRIQKSINSGIYMRSVTAPPEEVLPWKALVTLEVLDAAGFDYIIVETVGASQSSVDVANLVDTIVVVIVPGTGDDIQALKAGLMEIGDIYVISKCDKPEAEVTYLQVKTVLGGIVRDGWEVPILMTSALMNKGIKELYSKILEHHEFMIKKGILEIRRRRRYAKEVELMALELMKRRIRELMEEDKELRGLINKVISKEVNPFKVAHQIVKALLGGR